MRVQTVKIENYKNIPAIEVDTKGKSIIITGRNGGGKTSFIDAIFEAIDAIEGPEQAITLGKDKAKIKIGLGETATELIVEKVFTDTHPNGVLTITTNDGFTKKGKAAEQYLDDLLGAVYFDMDEFFKAKNEKDMLKYLNNFLKIDTEMIDAVIKENYDSRTITNREVEKLKGALDSFVPFTQEENVIISKGIVDVSDLLKKQSEKNELMATKVKYEESLERGNLTVANQIKEENEIEQEIKRLQDKLHILEEERKVNQEKLQKIKDYIPTIKIPEENYDEAIANAAKNNSLVDRQNDKMNLLEEWNAKVKESEDFSETIKNLREQKQQMYANANIANVQVTEDGILYNGLPLKKHQINTASLMTLAVDIILSVKSKLKTVRFDATMMDNVTYGSLLKKVEDAGYQCFIEKVDVEGGDLQINVIEGEA